MEYWKTIKDKNGFLYSCDMLRITFSLRSDEMEHIQKHFCSSSRLDIDVYGPCTQSFKFRNLCTIHTGKHGENSWTLGVGFNGTSKEDSYKCFIEVNPNKVFSDLKAHDEIMWVLACSTGAEVSRWDLAIDLPYKRSKCHLMRDKRKYGLEQTSEENLTEYLGCRNQTGRVKLYNKTIESKLDYDLTRLEITMGPLDETDEGIKKFIPEVDLKAEQSVLQTLDTSSLSNTQQVLVELMRQQDNPNYYLKKLTDRNLRKKLEPFLLGSYERLQINTKCIYTIVTYLQEIVKVGV